MHISTKMSRNVEALANIGQWYLNTTIESCLNSAEKILNQMKKSGNKNSVFQVNANLMTADHHIHELTRYVSEKEGAEYKIKLESLISQYEELK